MIINQTPLVSRVGDLISSGLWQLPEDNYEVSNFNLFINFPRPDTETNSYAGHRFAHSQMLYSWPVEPQFGAYPYKYELIAGPTGATIGEELDRTVDGITGRTVHTRGSNYGIVNWTPTGDQLDTETFTVRVTDQEGIQVTVTWVVTLDDSKFVFVDSVSGSDVAAGTYAAPLETFNTGLWANDNSDSSYADMIAVFRTGTYLVFDDGNPTTGTGGAAERASGVKPQTYMGFPGETATMDMSDGRFSYDSGGNLEDMAMLNLTFDSAGATRDNYKVIFDGTISDRQLFHNLTFDSIETQTSTDNPGCVVFFDDTTRREYIAVTGCTTTSNCTIPLYDGFACDKVLLGYNTGEAGISITGNWLLVKDDQSNCSVIGNWFDGDSSTGIISMFNQIGISPCENQEVSYNTIIATPNSSGEGLIEWNRQTSSENARNTYQHRNTFITKVKGGAIRISDADSGSYPVTLTADLYVPQDEGIWQNTGGSSGYTLGTPNPVSLVAGDFDSGGALTDTNSARTNYLGTLGAEIAGE